MVLLSGLALSYHQEILGLIWAKPESSWIIVAWMWHLFSWLITLALLGLTAILSYLLSQILFSVVIMDIMSRITEKAIKGEVYEPENISTWRLLLYLIRQEIPRTVIPVIISILIMLLGWITPLGPIIMLISSAVSQ